MIAFRVTVQATEEPVTLAEAKAHIGYDSNEKDGRFATLIPSARMMCESMTGRALLTQTITLRAERFPSGRTPMELPMAPLAAVGTVSYIGSDGNTVILGEDDYQVDTLSEPGRIAPARGCEWPSVDGYSMLPVFVQYTAGWPSAEAVPQPIREAMLQMIARGFEVLSPVITGTIVNETPIVRQLLDPYRVITIG